MGSYVKMLFLTSFKKISTWILLAFGLSLSFISISAYSKYVGNVTQMPNMLYITPFIFISIEVVIVVLHIYKEPENDGTELLIVSKPILRRQIVISKMLVLFTLIIGMQVVYLLTIFAATTLDTSASFRQKMQIALSFGIGGTIVSSIIGFLTIFISIFMGKVASLVIVTVIVSLFPVASIIVTPLTNGIQYRYEEKPILFLGLDENNDIILDSNQLYSIGQNEDTYKKYKKDLSYDVIAYGDIWYQWSAFYKLFLPSDKKIDIGKAIKIKLDKVTAPSTKYSMSLKNGEKFTYINDTYGGGMVQEFRKYNSKYSDKEILENLNTKGKVLYNWLTDASSPERLSKFNQLSLIQRLLWIGKSEQKIDTYGKITEKFEMPDENSNEGWTNDWNEVEDKKTNKHAGLDDVIIYHEITENDKLNEEQIQNPEKVLAHEATNNNFRSGYYLQSDFKKVGEDVILVNHGVDFVNKWLSISFWFTVMVVLGVLSTYKYAKKDFK